MSLCSTAVPKQQFLRFASLVGISKTGEKKTIPFEEDQSVYEVLTEAGVMSKDGTCSGNLSCGKCKVKVVSGKVPELDDDEKDALGDAPANIRLACGITCSNDMDGAVFEVA